MLVVVFSGVNHHNQTCVFETAIVSNESEETYVWLLKEFQEAMKGKCPKTIITDGDLAIRNAIRSVFPDVHHRLCAWHLLQNATANVKKPYFTKMLQDCMLGDYDVNEFEEKWKDSVEQCGLQDNSLVLELYSKKTMWATAHIRRKFFGGLRTTSRCEGLHSLIGRYVKHGYNFVEFLEQFDRCLERIRNNEIQADYISQHTEPVLKIKFQALESYAAKVYTRVIFKMFQEVLLNSSKVQILEVKKSPSAKIFIVGKYCTPNVKWNVAFYSLVKEFQCSCQRMESFGIPCSHVLSAMIQLNMRQIPKSLVLDRWSKGIKKGVAERFGQGGARAEAEMNVLKYGWLVQGCQEICRLACYSNHDYAEVKNFIENTRVRLKRKHGHRLTDNGDFSQIFFIGSSTQAASETLPLPIAVTNTSNGQGPCVGRPRRKKLQKCTVCRRMGHNRATCPIGIVLEKHLQNMGFDNENEGSDEDEDNEEGMNLVDG